MKIALAESRQDHHQIRRPEWPPTVVLLQLFHFARTLGSISSRGRSLMKKAAVTGRWFAAVTALTLGLGLSTWARAGEVFIVPADEVMDRTFVRTLKENIEVRIVAFSRWRPPQYRWATVGKLDQPRTPFPYSFQPWELDNHVLLPTLRF